MFSLDVVDTDGFLDMSQSAQALYFHLGMRADDDGFVNSPNKVMRTLGAAKDDLKVLITKGFVIPFPSGVLVLSDWPAQNCVTPQKYTETVCTTEKAALCLVGNRYALLADNPGIAALPSGRVEINSKFNGKKAGKSEGQPEVNLKSTQVRLGQVRLDNSLVTTPAGVGDEEKPRRAKKQREPFDHESKPYKCAAYLAEWKAELMPSGKDPTEKTLQSWADEFDKCNRLDGHSWDEIRDVMWWCREDKWWNTKIPNGKKFREHYDRLAMEAAKAGVLK